MVRATVYYVEQWFQSVIKDQQTIENQDSEIELLSRQLDNSLNWQEKSHFGTIKALMVALDAKDDYTAGHCLRVRYYAESIGLKLGLSEEQMKVLGEACLFYDIGKIGIPEDILNKPARLTEEEYEIVKKHSAIGADIVGSIHYFSEHANIISIIMKEWTVPVIPRDYVILRCP